MDKMKHIGIFGSFGSGNLGDEAAWISVKQFLCEKNPKYKYHTHIFHWGHPHQSSGHHAYCVAYIDDKEIAWINKNFEAFIITGGGIVGPKWGMTKLFLKKFLDKLTIPIYTISISADSGEYEKYNLENVAALYNKSRIFTVRDEYSRKVLCDIGLRTEKEIPITPDIVTAMNTADEKEITKYMKTKNMMVAASNCMVPAFSEFWQRLKISFPTFEVVPFVPSLNDITSAQMIRQNFGFELFTPTEMQYNISKMDFIIAGRLHAAVFAANVGTPFVAINYHPKVKAFCDSIGYPYYYPKDITSLKKDETEYGFDYSQFSIMDAIDVINEAMKNPVKPEVKNTSREILEEVYADMKKEKDETIICMYCGNKVEVSMGCDFFKCPSCKNVNNVNNAQ